MRSKIIHTLWEEDKTLFSTIGKTCQSDNEKYFFDHLFEMQQWDCCLAGELLISEESNDDRLFMMRINFDEYVIGRDSEDSSDVHVMNLTNALSLNLKDCGFVSQDITLQTWLKNRDYSCVRYDHNNDY